MFADIITAGGLGRGASRKTIPIEQIIIRNIDGVPCAVAFTVGNVVITSKAGDKDFESVLARLGEPPPDIRKIRS